MNPSDIPLDILQRLVALDQGARHAEQSVEETCGFLAACVEVFRRNTEASTKDVRLGGDARVHARTRHRLV